MTASPSSLAPVVAHLAELASAAKLPSGAAGGTTSSGFADALRAASLKREGADATTAAQATADAVTDAAAIAGLVMPWIIPLVPVIAAGVNAVAAATDAIAEEVTARPPCGSWTGLGANPSSSGLSAAMVSERGLGVDVDGIGTLTNVVAAVAQVSGDSSAYIGPSAASTTPLLVNGLLDAIVADTQVQSAGVPSAQPAVFHGSKKPIAIGVTSTPVELAISKGLVAGDLQAAQEKPLAVAEFQSSQYMVIDREHADPQTYFCIGTSSAGDGMNASDAISPLPAESRAKGLTTYSDSAAEPTTGNARMESLALPGSDNSMVVAPFSSRVAMVRQAIELRQDSRDTRESSILSSASAADRLEFASLAPSLMDSVDGEERHGARTERTIAPSPMTVDAPMPPAARELAPIVQAVDTRVATPGWHEAVAQRLAEFVSVRAGDAEIRLNPANLGPVGVEISYKGNEASLLITAAQPATRDALEQALPHLRELLAQQGIALGQANVRDSGSGSAWASAAATVQPERAARGEPDAAPTMPLPATRSNRLVDTFA